MLSSYNSLSFESIVSDIPPQAAYNVTSSIFLPPLYTSRRISYYIKPGWSNVTHIKYTCAAGNTNKEKRVFTNFLKDIPMQTFVSTDLAIAFVGDSLGYQLFHAFELYGSVHFSSNYNVWQWTFRRGNHPGLATLTNIRGNGSLAFWRMTGMWQQKHEYKALPYKGKGWNPQQAVTILNATNLEGFDAMVFRVPFGWIGAGDVTETALSETYSFAKKLLKVRVVVFVAMSFNNNVVTSEGWKELKKGNQRIRDFSKNKTDVYVLDVDALVHGLMQRNAWDLGLLNQQTSTSSFLNATILERVETFTNHPKSIPQVCAALPDVNRTTCTRNMLSLDGMHLCMETLGGRINAGITCLLACAFPNGGDGDGENECENYCNQKFMRLDDILPLDSDR